MFEKIPASLILLFLSMCSANPLSAQSSDDGDPDPQLFSIFPLGAQRGASLSAEIRGKGLEGTYSLWFEDHDVSGHIEKIEEVDLAEGKNKTEEEEADQLPRSHRVVVQLKIGQAARLGLHSFRLVSPQGVSNALQFRVSDDRVIGESETAHAGPDSAQPVSLPVIVNGRIGQPGELDYYQFEAPAGRELAFEVFCDDCRNSIREGFEPQIILYDSTPSWLDPDQVSWLASSPALPTDTSLVYQFEKRGRYLAVVGSLLGKGTPDYTYQLRIGEPVYPREVGEGPPQEATAPYWRERTFTRRIEPNWPEVLWSRTVRQEKRNELSAETNPGEVSSDSGGDKRMLGQVPDVSVSTTVPGTVGELEPNEGLDQAATVTVPVLIEGTIDRPRDTDTFRFKVESLQGLAFEIQTPDVTLPRFNPRLVLRDADGRELLTNIHKKIWVLRDESPSMSPPAFLEALEPKLINTFEPGEYYLQISHVTLDTGNPNCAYRVMIRPQISHVGEIRVQEDHFNLLPGEAKKLTLMADLEEGFGGELSFAVENLPQGVLASPGTDAEVRRGFDGNFLGYESFKRESYVPETQKVTIMLMAQEDAPITSMPQWLRLTVRPIVKGKPGPLLEVGKVPLMVVKAKETQAAENDG